MKKLAIALALLIISLNSYSGTIADFFDIRSDACNSIINNQSITNKDYQEACITQSAKNDSNSDCAYVCRSIKAASIAKLTYESKQESLRIKQEDDRKIALSKKRSRLSSLIKTETRIALSNGSFNENSVCSRDNIEVFERHDISEDDCTTLYKDILEEIKQEHVIAVDSVKSSIESMRIKFSASVSNGVRADKNDCDTLQNSQPEYRAIVEDCRHIASEQNTGGLRSGALRPTGCLEFADQMNAIDAIFKVDAMRVSIESKKTFGIFYGVIQSITSKELFIRSDKTRMNAYIKTSDWSKVFEPSNIYVGANVYGFGEQTGSRQVILTNGSQSTVAVIHAKCISPPNDFLKALGL